jgi:hypothetical protein
VALGSVRNIWIWEIGGELDNGRLGFLPLVLPAI